MKDWEDIIKDKLEEYESPLPEGSLAEFRTLRENGTATAAKKKAAPWIWGMTASVAAGLAAILLLRMPSAPEGIIQDYDTASVAVAQSSITDFARQPQITQITAAEPEYTQTPAARPEDPAQEESISSGSEQPQSEPQDENEAEDAEPQYMPRDSQNPRITTPPAIPPTIPQVELNETGARMSYLFNNELAVGGVLGAGALAAVTAAVVRPMLLFSDSDPDGIAAMRAAHADYLEWLYQHGDDVSAGENPRQDDPGRQPIGQEPQQPEPGIGGTPQVPVVPTPQEKLVNTRYHMPLKLGLSTWIPVSDRLFITAGVEYARYYTSYTYALAGTHKESVSYLDIPIRLNYALASFKMFDFYVGGGFELDKCFESVTINYSKRQEPMSMSLLGAAGIQLNLTKTIGLYIEPELSWQMSRDAHIFTTYRSEHPLMFSVATGLRFNIARAK